MAMCLLLASVLKVSAADDVQEIRLRTAATAGQHLRIQLDFMSNATVEGGVSKGVYYGDYVVDDPAEDIVIKGKVEQLECYGCQLTGINVEKATSLQILRCYNNALQTLDVSKCAELNTLDCHGNALTALDVSGNAKLERLNCDGNQLAQLSFSGANTVLARVECGNNMLESVDVSQLPALTDFYAENNRLKTVDFSRNAKMK